MNTHNPIPEIPAMPKHTRRKRVAAQKRAPKDPTANERVENFRRRMAACGMKRFEIQVPRDFSKEESALLREWLPEFIEDVRNAITGQQSEE